MHLQRLVFEDDKIYLSTCTTLFCLKAGNILAKYRKTLFAPDLHLKRIAPQENHILGLYSEKSILHQRNWVGAAN